MNRYILDADFLSALEDSDSPGYKKIFEKLSSLPDEDEVCMSIISIYEYYYGVFNAPDKRLAEELRRAKDTLVQLFKILPLSLEGAERYGKIKAEYKKRTGTTRVGMRRHNVDIILAGTALEQDAVIVSQDKIFSRIQEFEQRLQVENWAK
ncbi:MAG: type II toxin-antitoxin system VapC family toxin [Candidatus Aminicenantes bacterium]|nr:type II toxin-antitoxin system VapC family toxin [Candidatus Aminicenantes bacterium]